MFPRKRLRLRCASTASSTTEPRKAAIGRARSLSYLPLPPLFPSPFPLSRSLARSFTDRVRRSMSIFLFLHGNIPKKFMTKSITHSSLHRARRLRRSRKAASRPRATWMRACTRVRALRSCTRARARQYNERAPTLGKWERGGNAGSQREPASQPANQSLGPVARARVCDRSTSTGRARAASSLAAAAAIGTPPTLTVPDDRS